jgi:uncharacterized protein
MTSAMITSTPQGVIVNVRVIPRSSHVGIAGTRDNALLVRLHAPPLEGAANNELVEVLARAFAVPRRAIAILAGERNRAKRVAVTGITADDVYRALGP